MKHLKAMRIRRSAVITSYRPIQMPLIGHCISTINRYVCDWLQILKKHVVNRNLYARAVGKLNASMHNELGAAGAILILQIGH